MTQQKNPTSFYRRGTNNPKFGYYAEGNYSIVKPFSQPYFGFLRNITTQYSINNVIVSKKNKT
jgi:hypothetical protein